MKRKVWLVFIAGFLVLVIIYLFSDLHVTAESNEEMVGQMIKELELERKAIEIKNQDLEMRMQNLKSFETELDKKYDDYLHKLDEFKKMQADFQSKVEEKALDRKMLESFESIDPEQSAVLMLNLFKKDQKQAALLLRKMTGKKSGKILEAMIQLDPEISTLLAKETIDFYNPGK